MYSRPVQVGAIQHQLDRCLRASADTGLWHSAGDFDRVEDFLVAVHSLYHAEPDAVAAFGDRAYWEELSVGLHVTDELSERLAESRRRRRTAAR